MSTTKRIFSHSEATPTVFLHGFSGEGEGLRAFADVYSGKEAICIDMPGFGGTPPPSVRDSHDIREYCKEVWGEVRKAVPEGPVNLVGHSHGAMIGFVLAVQHPEEVARLDLFCPVARPRFAPRASIGFVRLMQRSGIPSTLIIRLMAHPIAVSAVTRYSFHKDWTAEDRERITKMRNREARFYSTIMFDLMQQTLQFKEVMADSRCVVPTRLCHVSDDNVASSDDYLWYEKHANITKIKQMTGGHLCVVADPARVVRLFGDEEDS